MELLASCSLEEAKAVSGKLVLEPTEEDGKPIPVKLNIVCYASEVEAIKMIGGSVRCVTFIDNKLPNFDGFTDLNNIFHEVSLEELEAGFAYEYPGVTTLLRVPSDYKDMRYLSNLCKQRKDLRVIGGNLLAVEGMRIGRYDTGKEKMSPVFYELYDSFAEVIYSELGNVSELVRKASKKLEGSDGEKKAKKVKVSSDKSGGGKKAIFTKTLNSLFGEISEEEF